MNEGGQFNISDIDQFYISTITTAAEDAPETFAGTEKAVQGWVDCFPRCTLVGTVFAGGVNGVGEILGRIELEQAYQMGKGV